MFRKALCALLAFLIIGSPLYAETSLNVIDELKGLQRSPKADKIANGAHTQFDDVYIKDGNIRSVKGRDRLNSSALSNTTTNGFWYYENAAGTTKKLLRFENTVLASYDLDGTNRTALNTGLTNEPHDAEQVGDNVFITSDTDGLYKWTGSGAASAVTGVSAPSAVDFSATTGAGGLTTGLSAVVVPKSFTSDTTYNNTSGTCSLGNAYLAAQFGVSSDTSCAGVSCSSTNGGTSGICFNTSNYAKTCATTTTYSYKTSEWNSVFNFEGEPSTADTAALTGADTITLTLTNGHVAYTSNTCATSSFAAMQDFDVTYSGEQTRTTSTLNATPNAPFDGSCIYRTVAGGSDYFKLGCVKGGGSTYTDGKPDAALGDPLDTTLDTITPPSYRYISSYKGVLFLAQGTLIQYSHLPVGAVASAEKYFLESDKIDTGQTKPITGLQTTSNSLMIFQSNSIQEITGFGATSFRLRTLFEGVGAVSDETIEPDSNGDLIFFAGVNGVFKLQTSAPPQDDLTGSTVDQPRTKLIKLSSPAMVDVFRGTDSQIDLDPADYAASHAYYDFDNDLYFLYIGDHCFIFDNANNTWSHIPAAKMGASFYRKSPNTAGVGVLVDTVGFFYNNWTGNENGIESGSVTGTVTASGNTTLTCGGCTFNTTNDGLKGLWVFLDNQNGEYRQIASNTGTQLTVSTAWTTNPSVSDSFYVAYIIPHIKTKQYSLEKAPKRTSMSDLWILNNKSDSSQILEIYGYQDKATLSVNATNAKTIDLTSQFAKKVGFNMNSPWVQWELRTFIYNTSNTINPPLDITSYAISGEVLDENSR